MDNPPQEAAKPSVLAAIGPDVHGGEYYGPQRFMESKGEPGLATPGRQALDEDSARKLWAVGDELTQAAWAL
ncbi:hypothetical protein IUS99_03330 [Mycobacteroides abscessus subsp. massiliense]|uniref:hypothetical protein n=1 Tax=Mycobacteroides abscessus TaxID=36809 RepID=UPI0019D150A4|nr:hypothetical protein [Mycobacteroides abscessus]MBN7315792.1 hypothetical protein [Mycobacteroides abscessus subsp. massiliense]